MIELARNELGLTVMERSIDRTETFICEEMFLTGTAAQVIAVTKIDHRPVGAGVMGPITTKLRILYEDILRGKNRSYEHWNVAV
jgi:branched-chain amino acid aminotransferase